MLKAFNEYRANSFIFQRNKKNSVSNERDEYFLAISDKIPAELDFNNLYKIYKQCLNNK